MAESTLSVGYSDLKREVGFYLGFGTDSAEFLADQLSLVDSIIQSGLRQFYNPPIVPGQNKPHLWSFLKPSRSITFEKSKKDYTLPDDVAGVDGVMTFEADQGWVALQQMDSTRIRELRQRTYQSEISSGRPRYFALRPLKVEGVVGQRYEMMVWPEPNKEYVMDYRYEVLPQKLSDTSPYPYGGGKHGETIIESCLAVAESRADDEQGNHQRKFMERLTASVEADARLTRPEMLGYNGDGSDGREFRLRNADVTVGGVLYRGT